LINFSDIIYFAKGPLQGVGVTEVREVPQWGPETEFPRSWRRFAE